MILEPSDKIKFIEWLEVTAKTCQCMTEQMEKLQSSAILALIKREKSKAAACLLIASDLSNSELITHE